MTELSVVGRTESVVTPADQVKAVPNQLYLVHMLCGSCYHRYDEVSVYAGYHWQRCPKCGGHFSKKVWGTKAEPVEQRG
jgi:NMD protein affecting ribosome stability and mRNA decay